MKNITFLPILSILISLSSCQSINQVQVSPLDNFRQIDQMLASLAEKPQTFAVSAQKASTITGKAGTIIHLEPDRLETLDGSPIGDQIEVELLELTNKADMVLQNAPTVSNGQLLVTGGAYFINMRSNGQQLRIKEGTGLEVEFPKLTDKEMSLFLGERDSLGQINWIAAQEKFVPKIIPDAVAPGQTGRKVQKIYVKKSSDEIGAILDYIEGDETVKAKEKKEILTEEAYQKYMKQKEEERQQELKQKKAWAKQQREIEYRRKTYEAIELLNFGWINCDDFIEDQASRINIALNLNGDSITEARFYAIFTDINSVMTTVYFTVLGSDPMFNPRFDNIPRNKEFRIIGLSAKNEVPYIFETVINPASDQEVPVHFAATTPEDIKRRISRLSN